eukprot:TRINITY_DN2694_c0_g1_i1.p1 TRINITY_DN2694_c0_g1~~TRINITY_DN2694_c0_g1_i1.p1  ORF type:complete len:144 (+),score=11.17 TRINITY_DN2694_c0_g1_i1:203-634(+)
MAQRTSENQRASVTDSFVTIQITLPDEAAERQGVRYEWWFQRLSACLQSNFLRFVNYINTDKFRLTLKYGLYFIVAILRIALQFSFAIEHSNNILQESKITIYIESGLSVLWVLHGTYRYLSLIHICRCRRYAVCRSRWSPYH